MEQLLLGALTIREVDDPLSVISKDFTGGVVIVEVGLKKLCNCGRDVCYKTMVSRHQVHFLHQTHGIKIIQHHRGYIFIDKSFIRLHFTPFLTALFSIKTLGPYTPVILF